MKIDDKSLREKIRNGLGTIKVQLGLNKPYTHTDTAYTLADGTLIHVSGPLEANSAVQVVTASGTAPIPDGTYTVCDAGGKQVSITTVAGNITGVETPAQQNTAFEAQQTIIAQALARIDKLEAETAAYRRSFAQVVSLVEMVAQAPAQPAAERPLNTGWTTKKSKPNALEVIKLLKDVSN